MPQFARLLRLGAALTLAITLAACGGGSTEATPEATGGSGSTGGVGGQTVTTSGVPAKPTSWLDAHRLAEQASFGPTEALVREISTAGPRKWIVDQMSLPDRLVSRYTRGGSGDVHQYTVRDSEYCTGKGDTCWRDNFSPEPLLQDFYSNALSQPDQLRQRVAFALQQLLVISGHDASGTYGLRAYHNTLLNHAFGNYRDLLRQVILSPVMGDFLNNANNDKLAPNENFARELMQLFTIGVCELNADATLKGGTCTPTYDNDTVRELAFALTGWTYPAGGRTAWGCPSGLNCRYYVGDMVPAPAFHDTASRRLLSGVSVPAGSTPASALEAALDSLLAHPNIAPFVARHLIQQLVVSNPAPAYVRNVAAALETGSYQGIGRGRKGDLAATVAAVLLDPQARRTTVARKDGSLRQPVLMFTGMTRALRGSTDGESFSWWWGGTLGQHVFMPPSVFNFFPPDYHVPGAALDLVGPAFGIHNAATAINRMQFLNCMIHWNPCGEGTRVDLSGWVRDYLAQGAPGQVQNPASPADGALVDTLSKLAYGRSLPADERAAITDAMNVPWAMPESRVKTAFFLIFASPRYQIVH